MRHYIALIHKDADSDYGVSFPDLPGVITAGSNLDEARKMATEALEFHLEGLAQDGEAAPEPSRNAADSEAESPSPSRQCPYCGGRMIIVETFEGVRPERSPSPTRIRIDTS